MADNNDQARRNEPREESKAKPLSLFERSLPMSREQFKKLFNYLDHMAQETECDNTLRLTKIFMIENGIENTDAVTKWLNQNGAYCDCQIAFNIQELF